MGGILDSVAGRRVTSAFMSLSNSSSWFKTGAQATEREGQEKGGEKDGARKRDSQMDKYSQKERTQASKDHRPRTKWQRVDRKRVIQRRAAGQIPHRTDGNREKERVCKRGRGKTLGSGLSEHPILEKGGLGAGGDREEMGGMGTA